MQELARHRPMSLIELRDGVLPSYQLDNPYKLQKDRGQKPFISNETVNAIRQWRHTHNLTTTADDQNDDWIDRRVLATLNRFVGVGAAFLETRADGRPRHPHAMCFQPHGPPEPPFAAKDIEFRIRIRDTWKFTDETVDQAAGRVRARFDRMLAHSLKRVSANAKKMKRTDSARHGAKQVTHFMWLVLWQCIGMSLSQVAAASQSWDQETITKLIRALEERIACSSKLDDQHEDTPFHRAELKMRVVNLAAGRGAPYGVYEQLWDQLWVSDVKQAQKTLDNLRQLTAKKPPENTVAYGVDTAAKALGLKRRPDGKSGPRIQI